MRVGCRLSRLNLGHAMHVNMPQQRHSASRVAILRFVVCDGVAVCCVIVCCVPSRPRSRNRNFPHDDDDTAFPQKRGEVLPYEA